LTDGQRWLLVLSVSAFGVASMLAALSTGPTMLNHGQGAGVAGATLTCTCPIKDAQASER